MHVEWEKIVKFIPNYFRSLVSWQSAVYFCAVPNKRHLIFKQLGALLTYFCHDSLKTHESSLKYTSIYSWSQTYVATGS